MQISPFRGIRCDVGQMSLKCPKKRKKSFSLKENDFFDLCAHLGSNQGPKDYETFGLYLSTWCKIVVSDLQKQYMNNFWNFEILLRNTFVTFFLIK